MRASGLRRAAALLPLLLLSACATFNEAPVVDLSTGSEPARSEQAAAPLPAPRAASAGEHVVAAGDTLYGIAFRHGLDYRSLADWNRVPPPFTIRPGQVLTLRAPSRAVVAPEPPGVEAPPSDVPQRELPADTVVLAAPDPAGAPPPGEVRTYGIDEGQGTPTPAVEPVAPVPGAPDAEPQADARVPEPLPLAAPRDDEPLRPAPDGAMPPPLPRAGSPAVATAVPPPPAVPAPATRPDGALARAVADPEPTRAAPEPAVRNPPQPAPPVVPAPVSGPEPEPAAAPARIAEGPSRTAGGVRWRWPAEGTLVNRFAAGDPARQGIDLRGRAGAPVLAAADGEVVYSGNGLVGYGELVIIKHSAEFLSAYGHNRRRLVAEGQRVKAGQPIAEMGRAPSGFDALHFEIRRAGRPTDPLQFLPPR